MRSLRLSWATAHAHAGLLFPLMPRRFAPPPPLPPTPPQTFSGSFIARGRFVQSADSEVSGRFLKRAPGLNVSEVEMTYTYRDEWTGLRERVTILDGRAFLEVFNDTVSLTSPVSVLCMPPSRIPPLADVSSVLRNTQSVPAWRVDARNEHAAPCLATDQRWMLVWGRLEAVLCQPHGSTNLVRGCCVCLAPGAWTHPRLGDCCRLQRTRSTRRSRRTP